MNTRRDFLKLGALWLPVLVASRVAYSFLRPALIPAPLHHWIIRDIADRIVYEGHDATAALKLQGSGAYWVSVSYNMNRAP